MKICFIAHGNFPHIGPYLDHFKAQGHDVVFIRLADGAKPNGIKTFDAYKGFPSIFPEKLSYILASLRARRFIQQYKPTVINAHFATSGGVAAFISGFHPYVITAHGTDLLGTYRNKFWRFVLAHVLNRASTVIVVSDQLGQIVDDLIGSEKVHVINVGIDTGRFLQQNNALYKIGEPLRLISTRRMEPVYDPECIIDALALLVDKEVFFEMTFVGGGPLQEQIERKAELQGVRKYIRFMGQVPNKTMPSLLAEHHVYLSASKWDGASLSLLEAMASGLFPIVTEIAANKAWIKDGSNGLLFGISDPVKLANCIEQFASVSDGFNYRDFNLALICQKGDLRTNMLEFEKILECL